MTNISVIKSELPKTDFAPSYKFFIYETDITNVDFKKISDFILDKEKKIIEKFPSNGDGDTGLGDNSLTARFKHFNVFEWVDECDELKILGDHIVKSLSSMINTAHASKFKQLYVQCWANVLRKGEKIKIHSHNTGPYSYVSGHIVVKANNTKTYYVNPIKYFDVGNRNKNIIESQNTVGKLTLFNNWIPHYTDEQSLDEERITIAFDLMPESPIFEDVRKIIRLI